MIRFENLEAVCKARQWGAKELSAAIERSYSQCNDMLERKKSFGEKIARYIEGKLDLPRNWLDEPHDPQDPLLQKMAANAHLYEVPPKKSKAAKLKLVTADTSRNASVDETTSPGNRGPLVAGENLPPYGVASQHSGTSPKRAPVVEWVRLGDVLLRAREEWPSAEMRAFQPPFEVSDHCLFVRVINDANSPALLPGDFVCLDIRKLSPPSGSIALFRDPGGNYHLARYRLLGDGKEFEAYDSKGQILDGKRYGLEVMGTFVTLQRDTI